MVRSRRLAASRALGEARDTISRTDSCSGEGVEGVTSFISPNAIRRWKCSNGTLLCPLFQRRVRFGVALGSALVVFVLLWPLYGFVRTPLLLGAVFAGIAIFDSISAILTVSYTHLRAHETRH